MENIVAIAVLILISVLNIIICEYYKQFCFSQKQLIDKQEAAICELLECNKNIWKYCLSRIISDAVDKEDYECANECKRILDYINSGDSRLMNKMGTKE